MKTYLVYCRESRYWFDEYQERFSGIHTTYDYDKAKNLAEEKFNSILKKDGAKEISAPCVKACVHAAIIDDETDKTYFYVMIKEIEL